MSSRGATNVAVLILSAAVLAWHLFTLYCCAFWLEHDGDSEYAANETRKVAVRIVYFCAIVAFFYFVLKSDAVLLCYAGLNFILIFLFFYY